MQNSIPSGTVPVVGLHLYLKLCLCHARNASQIHTSSLIQNEISIYACISHALSKMLGSFHVEAENIVYFMWQFVMYFLILVGYILYT